MKTYFSCKELQIRIFTHLSLSDGPISLVVVYITCIVRFCSWNTFVVDGHDIEALAKAFHDASTVQGKPTAIVAKTFKGKGIPGIKKLPRVVILQVIVAK